VNGTRRFLDGDSASILAEIEDRRAFPLGSAVTPASGVGALNANRRS
jgi:hypothetical protein